MHPWCRIQLGRLHNDSLNHLWGMYHTLGCPSRYVVWHCQCWRQLGRLHSDSLNCLWGAYHIPGCPSRSIVWHCWHWRKLGPHSDSLSATRKYLWLGHTVHVGRWQGNGLMIEGCRMSERSYFTVTKLLTLASAMSACSVLLLSTDCIANMQALSTMGHWWYAE